MNNSSISAIVSKRLGHSTIAITLDIYSHVATGLQEAAANGHLTVKIGCSKVYV